MSEERQENRLLIFFIAAIAATGGLLFGFDTGVISGALLFIKKDFTLTAMGQEFVVSAVLVGCIIGAAASGRLADRFGRRPVIIVTALIFMLGSAIAALSQTLAWLLMGRIIIGLAIGVASFTVPLYISEIAPPKYRGALVSLNQLLITIGIVVSYFIDDMFAGMGDGWRWMFAVGIVPALVLGIGMLFLPETPRWLIGIGRSDKARKVLGKIMREGDACPALSALGKTIDQEDSGSIFDLFRGHLKPAMMMGFGIMFVQQATGINTVIYYAPTIFQMSGFESATAAIGATIGVGVVNVLMTIVSMQFIDRLGRKPLLSFGLIGMVLSLATLGLAFHFEHQLGSALKWFTVGSLIVYIGSFAISLGPIAWLLISEVYPQNVRGMAMSLATLSNWVFNFIIALTFLSIVKALTPAGAFWLYAAIGAFGWWFCKNYVPETKGVLLEEIEENLKDGIPLKDLGNPRA